MENLDFPFIIWEYNKQEGNKVPQKKGRKKNENHKRNISERI